MAHAVQSGSVMTEMTKPDDRLSEIEALWAKATPGPWVQWLGHTKVFKGPATVNTRREFKPAGGFICDTENDIAEVQTQELADAAAIAAAPQDVKWLCAEVWRLRAELDSALDRAYRYGGGAVVAVDELLMAELTDQLKEAHADILECQELYSAARALVRAAKSGELKPSIDGAREFLRLAKAVGL